MKLQRELNLIFYKACAELRAEAARTYAGFLWWIIEPLISMGIYYLVFSFILARNIENYAVFLCCGLIPWRWFQSSVMCGANSVISSRSLMQQVYIHKLIFPCTSLLSNTFKFLIILALLIAFVLLSGYPISIKYTAIPIIMLAQGAFIAGCTLWCAAIMPFLPDFRLLLLNLLQLMMFMSAIFYKVEAVPEKLQTLLLLNPMTGIISGYRDILLFQKWPDWSYLGAILFVSTLLAVSGSLVIHRFNRIYPKIA
ncbi:MAG: ABC transporter permease [Kiritimatiellaeota bacterium]|nr:ABC transporter permease [Kiritimatiellota bacterium]